MLMLKLSTAVTIQMGPALDATDGVTEETGLTPTVELSKNNLAFAARAGVTITHNQNGWYRVDLTAADTGTLGRLIAKFDAAATHLPVWHEFTVVPANVYDSFVLGTDDLDVQVAAMDANSIATGVIATDAIGILAMANASIRPLTFATGAVDATAIGADAITEAKIADNAIATEHIATAAITADSIGANAIGSSELATDAIGSDQLATVAVNEIRDSILSDSTSFPGADVPVIKTQTANVMRALATGTADSGTDTTLVDAALTQADDYWNGAWLVITDGTLSGQARKISDFVASTDTITVDRAFTVAVATHTYEIWPADFPNNLSALVIETDGMAHADVKEWLGNAVTAGVGNRPAVDAEGISGSTTAADNVQTNHTAAGVDVNMAQTTPGSPTADTVGEALRKAHQQLPENPEQNAAFSNIEFLMVDLTDFVTPETGLTVTGERSIDGGAFTGVSGTIAEVSNGIYQFDADAADMNGGVITFRFSNAAAADTFLTIKTTPAP